MADSLDEKLDSLAQQLAGELRVGQQRQVQ
jgi:hypothetical protein